MPHSNTDDGPPHVLAINAGSSSLKFALYEATELLPLRLRGKIERIGLQDTTLTVTSTSTHTQRRIGNVFDHSGAARELTDWLEDERLRSAVQAVGHRVVHGGPR